MIIPTPAAYGATLLDQKWPGWHQRINLAELDQGSCADCTLAQLYGWYFDGLAHLGLARAAAEIYGFNASDCGAALAEAYLSLTEQWVREVAHRLIWDAEKVTQRRLRAAEAGADEYADDDQAATP